MGSERADGRAGPTIRIVDGCATGPTALAARDAALAAAGVHEYNLVELSSVVPADATVEVAGSAPDLGPTGARLHVVDGGVTARGPTSVSAGLAWTRSEGGAGIFYELGAETDQETVRGRLAEGIEYGRDLRQWGEGAIETRLRTAATASAEYVAAVVLATYGRASPFE